MFAAWSNRVFRVFTSGPLPYPKHPPNRQGPCGRLPLWVSGEAHSTGDQGCVLALAQRPCEGQLAEFDCRNFARLPFSGRSSPRESGAVPENRKSAGFLGGRAAPGICLRDECEPRFKMPFLGRLDSADPAATRVCERPTACGGRFADIGERIWPAVEAGRKDGTMMSEGAKDRDEAGRGGPLGLLLLTNFSMGLDCLPKTCPCKKHGRKKRGVPEGFTHPPNKLCPFEADNFPQGAFASCCSLRGKIAARELAALSEEDLSDRMFQDMTAEEALAFAEELNQAADRLEREHQNDDPKPKGAGWGGTWDGKKWVYETSTFEEALASIREAGRWYHKVGDLGFGVHAWY